MTIKELSQFHDLKREIKEDENRLANLKAKAYNAGSAGLTGMPRSGGTKRITERHALAINQLESIIAKKQARCIEEMARLEKFIASIPDSYHRRIFTLRFVDDLSWTKVALKLGGNNTADGVRMATIRFLKKPM